MILVCFVPPQPPRTRNLILEYCHS
jgi:hypothetical protein